MALRAAGGGSGSSHGYVPRAWIVRVSAARKVVDPCLPAFLQLFRAVLLQADRFAANQSTGDSGDSGSGDAAQSRTRPTLSAMRAPTADHRLDASVGQPSCGATCGVTTPPAEVTRGATGSAGRSQRCQQPESALAPPELQAHVHRASDLRDFLSRLLGNSTDSSAFVGGYWEQRPIQWRDASFLPRPEGIAGLLDFLSNEPAETPRRKGGRRASGVRQRRRKLILSTDLDPIPTLMLMQSGGARLSAFRSHLDLTKGLTEVALHPRPARLSVDLEAFFFRGQRGRRRRRGQRAPPTQPPRPQTAVLNTADAVVPGVARLMRQIMVALRTQTSSNLYISKPGASMATQLHNDREDTLILHLFGKKTWHVFRPKVWAKPFRAHQRGKRGDVIGATDLDCGNWFEATLAPGDMLYVPRGFYHNTSTQASAASSAHLTVNIYSARIVDVFRVVCLLGSFCGCVGRPCRATHSQSASVSSATATTQPSHVRGVARPSRPWIL